MASTDEQGTSYEAEHVHEVYEQIASHFSSTRYKVCVAGSFSLATQAR
jgi:tRNA (uracil-5-)-methyltransferase TRM9